MICVYGSYQMAKKRKPLSNLEIIKRIRNDWGNVKPYSRPHKDKKKYDRKKQRNIED